MDLRSSTYDIKIQFETTKLGYSITDQLLTDVVSFVKNNLIDKYKMEMNFVTITRTK